MTTQVQGLELHRQLDFLPQAARGHFLAGRFDASSIHGRVVLNPATGRALLDVPDGNAQTVDRAVAAASAALPGWRTTTPKVRAAALHALAARIDEATEDLARLEALNTGKPLAVAREEIPMAADALRFFAGAARAATAPASGVFAEGHASTVVREPLGVIGAITPWNYPMMMAAWKIAPALAAGNTVVLKPSELTPLTTLKLAEFAADVLPVGVLNVVLGDGPTVGAAIAAHPGIAMVSLTGSVASGREVARLAVGSLKRVHLELGGKAPVVVCEDADLQAAAETLRVAGFWNSGQECGSATRVLVHDRVHDEFVALLTAQVRQIAMDDPDAGEHVEMGPLISQRQHDTVRRIVNRCQADGGQIVAGSGGEQVGDGFFYPPTVIDGVISGSQASREEIFGPVVTVESFGEESDAVREANAVEYGLASSVWTRDLARANRLSAALDFGTVWVNSHLVIVSEMPWGGFKSSGYGRDMSSYGLDDYTRSKHVMTKLGE